MNVKTSELVIFAYVVSLIGTAAIALGVIFTTLGHSGLVFIGSGIIAWIYAGMVALSVACQKSLIEFFSSVLLFGGLMMLTF
ncbi:hypothetical protein [Anianabacter salinae]|uniref:hypothetical protein n=1 Tax=Anianabacter salinae TaxID=2851023 RepID=UPI00225E0035|nr:hypothetical protein [Anianabacter salinae]MBV0912754.1 hypothetical protein [Anianabacter salinae]